MGKGKGKARRKKCPACKVGMPANRMCEECKAEVRRLADLHLAIRAGECDADKEFRMGRIEFYAAVVKHNGRLFDRKENDGT